MSADALGIGDACADLGAVGVDDRDRDAGDRLVVGSPARVTLLVEHPDPDRVVRLLGVGAPAAEGEESGRDREQRDDHTFQLRSCQLALPLPGRHRMPATLDGHSTRSAVDRQACVLTRA